MSVESLELSPSDMLHADTNQYLTFMLNGEEYGVEILRVQGIQGWDTVTPIPSSPNYVLGVMNLRGAIVPIIDLRKRFDMESIEFGPTTVIIVVRVENGDKERTIGMVVDAVSEVYRVDEQAVQAMPDFGGAVRADFIKGLSTVDDKMLILLDIDKLLSIKEVMSTAA
ncbi:Chemotaxis protein CheW [Zhongshania aliphaticivorans]|uniref:Chemotaxis protein CheW n=1 Tax=Zhongshania aliphaticivorans TaxID=1470434 RepID=A0A5S9NMC5_9GAMM|nr:chemotaxis protein CheW [Zhongshania aliphaticivorans]CAA0091258.1 Chemotaxis protein CheW [Zhongshania aliphaticivorans]CAA0098690.1 Chemotaxis protein CheW [Zhongshania aliphaticivorans]